MKQVSNPANSTTKQPNADRGGGRPLRRPRRRVTTITATIAAIDKVAGTVTLRGLDGEDTTIKARNRDNLDHVAVGDLVDITCTEALAVSVETPGAQ
jgi:hypothetical protein